MAKTHTWIGCKPKTIHYRYIDEEECQALDSDTRRAIVDTHANVGDIIVFDYVVANEEDCRRFSRIVTDVKGDDNHMVRVVSFRPIHWHEFKHTDYGITFGDE